MKRTYLEEDLALIRKYFPGARATTMHTPFELTQRPTRTKLEPDHFRDDEPDGHWYGDLLWNR